MFEVTKALAPKLTVSKYTFKNSRCIISSSSYYNLKFSLKYCNLAQVDVPRGNLGFLMKTSHTSVQINMMSEAELKN